MSDYQKAIDFFNAFIQSAFNYPYNVCDSVIDTAREVWTNGCSNTEPSKLKEQFISEIKKCADLFEKKGGHQCNQIAEAIREILNELCPTDINVDDVEEGRSNENYKKKSKECDITLAGQFVAESMTGEFDYQPYTLFSDSEYIQSQQRQYAHYCMMAKSNIVKDSFGPMMDDPLMTRLKKYVIDYMSDGKNKEHPGMKYLYNLQEDKLIIHQISMFSFMANMKNVEDIYNVTQSDIHNALNLESVCLAIGLYTYFTINVNIYYRAKDFNKLFVESWLDYFNNIQARIIMLKMRGNNWKSDFAGALLSDE